MSFALVRADYLDKRPDRPPIAGVEHFPAGNTWENLRPTMSALRRELSAQGALIAEDDVDLPVDFAVDAERIHAQTMQTADGWHIFPKAVAGSLAVLSDEPVIREQVTLDFGLTEPLVIDPVDVHSWRAFLKFLRGCAEHGGFVVT